MLIRTEPQSGKVATLTEELHFRRTLEELHPEGGTPVAVVIQVKGEGGWWDVAEYWTGPYSPDTPRPTRADLIAVATHYGAKSARTVIRVINGASSAT